MQPTYFASFLLGDQKDAPAISDGLEVISEWIFNNPHRPMARPQDWPNVVTPVSFSNGERVQLLRLTDGEESILQASALRYEHPDPQGRTWRTDCVLSKSDAPDSSVRFSITVSAGGAVEREYAIRPPTSRPRIVRHMMEKFGAREQYALTPKHLDIKTTEAAQFAGFLLDPVRALPLVFISRQNVGQSVLCDPGELADKLVGIAYVCVADSSDLSWALQGLVTNRLNAYDGTIRIYWPRMTLNDAPFRHRWWNKRQLSESERRISDELLRIVGTASVTRHVAGLVRWEDVERENTRRTILRLQSTGVVSGEVPEEWLKQYETDLAALAESRRERDALSELMLERDEEIRRWKQLYLQALRSQATGKVDDALDETVIEDVSGAILLAKADFADSLVFIDGRVSKEALSFEEPELLYAAFKWLATTYRRARMGTERCKDLDKSCREACEFRYNAHQSDITMSMYPADYEVSYNGEKTKLKEHIGFGTSTEPRHTIRIAFFFDDKTNKVIIGYVGQHQTTRKSN